MNKRKYVLMFGALAVLVILASCKKVEKQFPKGDYKMDIVAGYTHEGIEYDVQYTNDRVKLVETNEEYLMFRLYKFGANPFDTVYFEKSTLAVADKQYVEGLLYAGLTWIPEHDYYELSNGKIVKVDGEHQIHGDISFHGIHEEDWGGYEVVVSGTYQFKKKN